MAFGYPEPRTLVVLMEDLAARNALQQALNSLSIITKSIEVGGEAGIVYEGACVVLNDVIHALTVFRRAMDTLATKEQEKSNVTKPTDPPTAA